MLPHGKDIVGVLAFALACIHFIVVSKKNNNINNANTTITVVVVVATTITIIINIIMVTYSHETVWFVKCSSTMILM